MALKRSNVGKLVRVLGLLASDQPGERASAALAATRLVSSLGTSWADLLEAPPSKVVVQRVRDYGVDPQGAAEARMRQLKATNDRLERQNRALRRRLTAIAEQKRRERMVAAEE